MQEADQTLKQSFEIYYAYKKVGTCVFCVENHQMVNRTQQSVFPDSWFSGRRTEYVSPFLRITGLTTVGQKQQGNGRLCLQALYECSNRYGCSGRMLLNAAFGSAPFYEHCGFKGRDGGQDGIKYFEPNEQSLSLLYKDSKQEGTFKLIPLFVPHTAADKELLDGMIRKAQNERQRS